MFGITKIVSKLPAKTTIFLLAFFGALLMVEYSVCASSSRSPTVDTFCFAFTKDYGKSLDELHVELHFPSGKNQAPLSTPPLNQRDARQTGYSFAVCVRTAEFLSAYSEIAGGAEGYQVKLIHSPNRRTRVPLYEDVVLPWNVVMEGTKAILVVDVVSPYIGY